MIHRNINKQLVAFVCVVLELPTRLTWGREVEVDSIHLNPVQNRTFSKAGAGSMLNEVDCVRARMGNINQAPWRVIFIAQSAFWSTVMVCRLRNWNWSLFPSHDESNWCVFSRGRLFLSISFLTFFVIGQRPLLVGKRHWRLFPAQQLLPHSVTSKLIALSIRSVNVGHRLYWFAFATTL